MKLLYILGLLSLMSCSKAVETKPELTFETKVFSAKKCADELCATVDVSYPVASAGEVGDKINADITNQMLAYFNQEKDFSSLDSASEDYLQSNVDFKKDFPDAPGGWSEEINVILSYESDSTLSFQFTEFNFSGGAHPNSSVYYMNFDKQSGEFLSVDRVVLDENKMLALAEKAFRAHHEVADSLALSEDGRFFLPEIGFFLPNAMGYSNDKFVISYIPYEIGPYVMGYTDLEFDLKDLKGIVRTR